MFLQLPFQQHTLFWKQSLTIIKAPFSEAGVEDHITMVGFLFAQSSAQAAFTSRTLLILLYTLQRWAN